MNLSYYAVWINQIKLSADYLGITLLFIHSANKLWIKLFLRFDLYVHQTRLLFHIRKDWWWHSFLLKLYLKKGRHRRCFRVNFTILSFKKAFFISYFRPTFSESYRKIMGIELDNYIGGDGGKNEKV